VQYFIDVTGPQGTTGNAVPVLASGAVSAQLSLDPADNGFGIGASVKVASGQNYTFVALEEGTTLNGAGSQSVPYSQSISLTAGTLYQVFVIASTELGATATGSAQSASASADPTFTIDPAYAAKGYSIQYSAGFAPVPLPSSGLLLLGALALFAGATWKRVLA
jgi:hypothetical protein